MELKVVGKKSLVNGHFGHKDFGHKDTKNKLKFGISLAYHGQFSKLKLSCCQKFPLYSARNKDQKLVGRFLKMGHFIGY